MRERGGGVGGRVNQGEERVGGGGGGDRKGGRQN